MESARSEPPHTTPKRWEDRSLANRASLVATVALGYFLAARVGLSLSFEQTNATPVWPSSGIALAAVLLLGWKVWPGVLLGAWLTNALVLFGRPDVPVGSALLGATLMASGNTLECLAGRAALRRLGSDARPFDRIQDVFKFVFVAAAVAVVAASVGLVAMIVAGAAAGADTLELWLTWWLGDAAGIVVYAPALLAWTWPSELRWSRARVVEAAVLGLSFVPTGFVLFGWLPEPTVRSLPYLVMPLLLWVVLRFSLREAAAAVVLVAAVATWGTVQQRGPFATGTLNESLLLVQSFVGTVAVTVLALSAALTERRQLNAALRKANESLEQRVNERTLELSETNERLSRQMVHRERMEREMRRMAQHDSLTGLANRRLLEELFDTVEALARRHDAEMALLFIDLDDFKPINDTLGHRAGDEVLMTVASRLEASVRESDLVARFGGDEFVVVLPELSKPQDVMGVAEKLLGVLTQPIRIEDESRELGVSIGIARYPQDGRDLQGLLRCADHAMYSVKQRGKNGYALYES